MPFAPGARVAHYQIVALIGEGGMGAVYRATDDTLHRTVAIKVVGGPDPPGRHARAQLLQEARAASALNHPHICTVHEIGEHDGQPFIVMEHIDGRPLSAGIPGGGFPTETVIRLGRQIADALTHAHAAGIVHRDLKSSNIAVNAEGHVKVVDFGIAARMASADVETITHSVAELGDLGSIAGTLPYMAPEVLQGEAASAQSDIWSLGVVLYELLAGQRPFTGFSGGELTASILRDRPRALPARGSPALGRVITRCLAKEPGHRYQHAAEVRAALEALETPSHAQTGSRATPRQRRITVGLAGAGLIGVAVALGVFEPLTDLERSPITSVAVLPLDNLMNSPGQAYFVDGMTEALISELAGLGDLRVISRTSAMQYADRSQPLPEIATALGVDAVVEGSVLRAGDDVRITAQLVDGRTDESLWTGTYERGLSDVLRLQREVAVAIASEIGGTLIPESTVRVAPLVDPEAHEAYLWGRHYWNRRTASDLQQARTYFEQAIDRDPMLAVAHAGLADTYTMLGVYGTLSGLEAGDLAQASARRALELEPNLAQAHTALGYSLFTYNWDWVGAEASLRRAVELNPSDAASRHWFATVLMATGQLEDATRQIAVARTLDPLSPLISSAGALVDSYAGQHQRAIDVLTEVLANTPDWRMARLYRAQAYRLRGNVQEAIIDLEALTSGGATTPEIAELAGAYALAGRREEGVRLVEGFTDPPPSEMVPLALAWYRLGDRDQALRWLTAAFEQRAANLVTLSGPYFDEMRDDEPFRRLFERLDFPPRPRM